MPPPPSTSAPFSRCSVRLARAGGVRVVRDHDDRLAVLAVERLQQVEDLVAGLAIEVAGRLVAEQQRRVGDDRAGDADALLLAAGELARVVLRAVGEADDLQRDRRTRLRRSAFDSLVSSSGSSTLRSRGQHRQQVVELEDEADVPRAPARRAAPPRQLVDALAADLDRCPPVGVSSPPIRLSSVVLPEPDGPISARKSPCGMSRLTPCSTSMRSLPRWKTLWTSRTRTERQSPSSLHLDS